MALFELESGPFIRARVFLRPTTAILTKLSLFLKSGPVIPDEARGADRRVGRASYVVILPTVAG